MESVILMRCVISSFLMVLMTDDDAEAEDALTSWTQHGEVEVDNMK